MCGDGDFKFGSENRSNRRKVRVRLAIERRRREDRGAEVWDLGKGSPLPSRLGGLGERRELLDPVGSVNAF